MTATFSDEIIRDFLWPYGHFKNVKFPTGLNVTEADLDKLTLADQVVKDAIQSIQELDANSDVLSQKHHGRAAIADGEMGPATAELLTLPRCGEPDYGNEPAPAGGDGGWLNCAEIPDVPYSVRWYIDAEHASSRQRGYLEQCIDASVACSAEIGIAVVVLRPGDFEGPIEQNSELSVLWPRGGIFGGTIGYQFLPTSGTCEQHRKGKLDNGFNPSDWRTFAALIIHESLGHGIGSGHHRGGLMNPSILSGLNLSWIGDPAERTVKRLYPRWRAIDWPRDDNGGDPDPTPGDGRLVFRGGFTAVWHGEKRVVHPGDELGDFHLVPKPEG